MAFNEDSDCTKHIVIMDRCAHFSIRTSRLTKPYSLPQKCTNDCTNLNRKVGVSLDRAKSKPHSLKLF